MVDALEMLMRGTVQVLPENLLNKKLELGMPLRIKLGMDPTAPDLHLGHAVVLGKMRDFQDAGHQVIFLIGDFTALVGDPSGKTKTRPALSAQEIEQNAKTYFEQVGKILDPDKTEIRYNSEWLSKFDLAGWLKLSGKITLARIIERDDFAKRLVDKTPIGFHELFYPLMQGYDSVALEADVELGGSDQTFNLLMGRFLQESYGQESQVIMTMPLLVGLDGVQKMSKSLGNHIGLLEKPEEAYGKLMSISDELMWSYYRLLLDKTDVQVKALQENVATSQLHPMDVKKDMAQAIVAKYWSSDDALRSRQHFESLFQKHDYSKAQEIVVPAELQSDAWIVDVLKQIGAVQTSSEAKRLIQSGAVSFDGQAVKEFKARVSCPSGTIIKVGKHRIYKVQ